MGKFYGAVGYAESVKVSPGVYQDKIVDHMYYGELIRNISRWQTSESVNDDLNINNQISIVADQFAYENFHAIKYVEFMGAKWKVTSVEVRRPRLILTIGGLYNV